MPPEDPRVAMRASDRDRNAVASILQDALAEGRLDLHELDERLAAVYASRTRAELETFVADLPDTTVPWAVPLPVVRETSPVVGETVTLSATWRTQKRTGPWEVPRRIVVEPALSDVRLDFREAACPHPRVDIAVSGGLGSLVLVLPDDWSVDTSGVEATWGSVKNRHRSPAGAGRPTIVVAGPIGIGTVATRGAYFYE